MARTAGAGTMYVDGSVSSSGSGASWATAKKTIQEGVNAAGTGDEVHVAAGTYLEAIVMKGGVLVYGGYPQGGGARNLPANETVVDGSTARGGLPAYHVVTMDGLTATTHLDGFKITGGGGGRAE